MGHVTIRLPISVVIPAFLAEGHIQAAIESISREALVPSEIIVVDDASSDRTAEIARVAGARVIRLPRNSGPSVARNAGVAAAREPWIAFLDADDVWIDRKLAAQWKAIRRWPDAGFCFTDYDAVDARGNIVQSEMATESDYAAIEASERAGDMLRFEEHSFARGLVRTMFIRQSSVIVKRSLFLESGGYDETLRLGEDHDLFLRLSAMAPVIAVERALVTYRRRKTSLSADPLAEVSATDRLWTAVLARPRLYPPTAVTEVPKRRYSTLHDGSVLAMRLGRFAAAASFARAALAVKRTPMTLAVLGLATALNNPLGKGAHLAMRSMWRVRPAPRRPVSSAADFLRA